MADSPKDINFDDSDVESSKEPRQKFSKDEKEARDNIQLCYTWLEGDEAKRAQRLKDAYNGKYWSRPAKRHRFTVNTIFSLVQLLLPNLVFRQPYIRATAMSPRYLKELADGKLLQVDAERAATVRQAAVNYEYSTTKSFIEQRRAVMDAFFYGFGMTKAGYSYQTASEADNDYVTKDTRFLKRINPQDVGFHPLATGLDDSPVLIHRMLTTKDRLKTSGKYKNVDNLVPSIPRHMEDRLKNAKQHLKASKYVTLYEVHDLERDKIYTFGGEGKVLLAKQSNPYEFQGPHFSIIRFAHDNECFTGLPLLAMIEDEALALNEIMTLMVEHMRKFPGAAYYNIGSLSEETIERIKNGEQGSIHGVESTDSLKFQNPLSMGGEYFSIVQLLQSLIDRILGVPDFQRSVSPTTRRSATEATIIHGDATVRRQYYLDLVKDFMLDGVKKLASLQAQFQDETLEIKASGELNGMIVEFDKSDLQGEMNLDFDIEELQAFNETQAAALNAALNVLASHEVLHPVLRTLDPEKLGKIIFKSMGKNIESLQQGDIVTSVFVRPEKENELARKGEPMPSPKRGEDHKYHMQIHSNDLQQNGMNNSIIDHLAETVIMQQIEDQEKGKSTPMADTSGGLQGAQAGAPVGPSGGPAATSGGPMAQ